VKNSEDLRPDLSVVVPVFDELDTIEALVARTRTALEEAGLRWELVVVDDGSEDGSDRLLDELAEREPRLRVVHLAARYGQSAALAAGFERVRGRLTAVMDGDLQTFPEDLPGLIDDLESSRVDAVVGIRTERTDPWWKKVTSSIANRVRNWLTREDIVDTGCPIKVVRTAALRSIPSFDGMHRFLPTLLRMAGATVRQVPVRHAARSAGRSKYGTVDRAVRGLRDALGVRWLQDRRMRWRLR
jgi:glycosyltransferase involved in cell wall biosynthesis